MIKNKKVFVIGLGTSGFEASKLLCKYNNDVTLNDAKDNPDKDRMKILKDLGVNLVLGSEPADIFDTSYDLLVRSPGVPLDSKYVQMAEENNIPVITDPELAYYFFPKDITIVGVTGTNGKTTVTTIIYEILKKYKKNTYLGGNIGPGVSGLVDKVKSGDTVVLEISDHQLASMHEFKTNISVFTNIYDAHADFHGSHEKYVKVKLKIFNHHTNKDIAVLNKDNDELMEATKNIKSNKIYFGNNAECTIKNNKIYYKEEEIVNLKDVKLKGVHNYENIMCSIIVCKELGVPNNIIKEYLKEFKGVEHRLEYVDKVNNREFYNDSKSTNNQATITALNSFNSPVILILGGLNRDQDWTELKRYLNNVKLIVCYGENKNFIRDFSEHIKKECIVVNNIEEATKEAYSESVAGDTILLSPASASWDQFKNFEIRGNKYKETVNEIKGGN